MDIKVTGDVYINQLNDTDLNIITLNKVKKRVRIRDGGCVCCGKNDDSIQIHHIYPKSLYPYLSLDESNMICLCKECHDKYHNNVNLLNVNPLSLLEFLKEK